MVATADLVALYPFAEGPEELQKTRAGADDPKYLLIPRCVPKSNILNCRHESGLGKNGFPVIDRYK